MRTSNQLNIISCLLLPLDILLEPLPKRHMCFWDENVGIPPRGIKLDPHKVCMKCLLIEENVFQACCTTCISIREIAHVETN